MRNGDAWGAVFGAGPGVEAPLTKMLRLDLPPLLSLQHRLWAKRVVATATSVEEERGKLVSRHGEEKDGRSSISAGSPHWEEFLRDYATLMDGVAEEMEPFGRPLDSLLEKALGGALSAVDQEVLEPLYGSRAKGPSLVIAPGVNT